MLQTRPMYPERQFESFDHGMSELATSGSVLLVLPADQTEAMAVAERGARLAAALDRVPTVHVFRNPHSTRNGHTLPPAFVSGLRSATGAVTPGRMPITIIDRTDIQAYIRDVAVLMQPSCIIAPATLRGIDRINASSTRRWLIENCPVPLWLVSPHNAARRPVILAAIDTIGDNHATSSLDRTVLRNASYLAGLFNAELHVCHSVSLGDLPQTIQMQLEPIRRQEIERWLRQLRINAHDVHVLFGQTNHRIGALANTLKPQLVVLGAANRTIWHRLFTTNITRAIVESLDRDILIVRSETSLMPNAEPDPCVLQ